MCIASKNNALLKVRSGIPTRSFCLFLLFASSILIIFNNAFGVYAYSIIQSQLVITAVNASKELFILMVVIFLFFRLRRRVFLNKLVISHSLLFVYALALPTSSPITPYLVSLKELFSVTCIYILGTLIAHTRVDVREIVDVFWKVILAVLVFSFLEYVASDFVWLWGRVDDYYAARFGSSTAYFFMINDLPQHWYTYLSESILVRRMVGPVGDAPTLARLLCIACIVAFFRYKDIRKYTWALLFFVFLVPTFSRSAILFFGVVGSIYFWNRNKLISIVLLSVIFAFIGDFLSMSFMSANFERHITGFTLGFSGLLTQPFGAGLGTFGTAAVMYGGHGETEMVAESFLGGTAAQLGIIGIVLWYAPFIPYILKGFSDSKHSMTHMLVSATIIGSFLSNMSISTVAAFLPMLLFGYHTEKEAMTERAQIRGRLYS